MIKYRDGMMVVYGGYRGLGVSGRVFVLVAERVGMEGTLRVYRWKK